MSMYASAICTSSSWGSWLRAMRMKMYRQMLFSLAWHWWLSTLSNSLEINFHPLIPRNIVQREVLPPFDAFAFHGIWCFWRNSRWSLFSVNPVILKIKFRVL